jgi:hypothetical protein
MGQLKMQATDGKYYQTDVADAEQLLRLIQSVPSPKAEPFKCWLARVGYERLEVIENPELVALCPAPYHQKPRGTQFLRNWNLSVRLERS